MLRDAARGLRGSALIAATYIYFLIFAQFGFLSRLSELNLSGRMLPLIMASMAVGGILFSLLGSRLARAFAPATRLRAGFAIAGSVALLSLAPLNLAGAAILAFFIGTGLGIVTVTLVSDLRAWTGERRPLLLAGIGTGLGYFVCNIPGVFDTDPRLQATLAAAVCAAGVLLTLQPPSRGHCAQAIVAKAPRVSFAGVLARFAALVWLDSAAFYIIQHVPELKGGTWLGSVHLWTNGTLHLVAAACAGAFLTGKSFSAVLAAAYVALAGACVLLAHGQALPASLFYPIGVSLYSVALVAYPSLLTTAADEIERARQAGYLYAIAGWVASALGIGMGQNLGRVPLLFVIVAGVVVLGAAAFDLARVRTREAALTLCTLATALAVSRVAAKKPAEADSLIDRGRRVYISEGCIHCHSQYVRPGSRDVELWGPVEDLVYIRREAPPLIGNRRQGPDLTQVGSRRSPLWLKAHLIDPAQVSGGSIMPSFAFLFRDQRGDDLVAYLSSLQNGDVASHLRAEQQWAPSAAAAQRASIGEGKSVYANFCATCHERDGATLRAWQNDFHKMPGYLLQNPQPASAPASADSLAQVERIAKFGIPGTDMPGHEYLSDEQIASVSLMLQQSRHNSTHQ